MKTENEIIESVKTVEDAQNITGMVLPKNMELLPVDVQAFIKLRIVAAALNGLTAETLDNFPKFTAEERRYYPWFWLITKKEYVRMTAEEKGRCVGRSSSRSCTAASFLRSRTALRRARTRATRRAWPSGPGN